jgi:hypothetical protein
MTTINYMNNNTFYALYDSERGLYQVLYSSDGYPAQDANCQPIFITLDEAIAAGLYAQNNEQFGHDVGFLPKP